MVKTATETATDIAAEDATVKFSKTQEKIMVILHDDKFATYDVIAKPHYLSKSDLRELPGEEKAIVPIELTQIGIVIVPFEMAQIGYDVIVSIEMTQILNVLYANG